MATVTIKVQAEQTSSSLKNKSKQKIINFNNKQNSLISVKSSPTIGIIGAGGFASNVLIPILNKTKVKKIAICNNSSHSSHHRGRKFGFEYCTTNGEKVFKDENINSLIISTRHNSHSDYVLRALESNKNVFP